MDARTQTTIFMLVWVAAAIAWDVYVVHRYGAAATISSRMLDWAERCPWFALSVAFSLGLLVGHLFLPQGRAR